MTSKESHTPEPEWHLERWLPDFDVDAFHAANRLVWDKGDGWPVGYEPKKVEATEQPEEAGEDEELEHTGKFIPMRDENGKALLGKKFLDATNHWKRNPEASIDDKLSIEGKRYLEEVTWVFDRVRNDLIASKGKELNENPLVSGLPLDEWLITIVNEKIQYEEEFEYIAKYIDKAQQALRKIRDALLTQEVEVPKATLLERLEAIQGAGRRERFSPQKRKGE